MSLSLKKLGLVLIACVTIGTGVAGCSNTNVPQPEPFLSALQSPLPTAQQMQPTPQAPALNDQRGQTALAVLPAAQEKAKQWNKDAMLYEIPATRQMEKNLGLPAGAPGWFFMFKVAGSPLEYYVEVIQGAVAGATEAQAVFGERLPYRYSQIDLASLAVQSDQVLRLFMEGPGKDYLKAHPDPKIDYRLVHLEGDPHAVWSLYDTGESLSAPIFNIDATTGQIVPDPFQRFQKK